MLLAILSVLYILGFLVYFLKRDIILYYYIVWSIFAPYVSSFVLFDRPMTLIVGGQANYFLVLIFLINSLRFKSLIVDLKTVKLLIAISFFLLIAIAVNSVSPVFYLKWFISNIVPIYLVVSIQKTLHTSLKSLTRFVLFMLLVQLIVGFCQYYTTFLFVSPLYALSDSGIALFTSRFFGTFPGENAMAAFVSICILILIFEFTFKNNFFKNLIILFSCILAYYAILVSGIRTYLILIIVFSFIILYIKADTVKTKALVLATIGVSFVVISSFLIVSSYGTDKSSESGIERQINGISSLKDGNAEESTLFYSFYMLEEYYYPIDLFGKGLLNTKNGYGLIRLDDSTSADVTDATLAVYLVEFGIILLILFIYYYYYLTCACVRSLNRKNALFRMAVFSFYLISTITDAGIFNIVVMSLLAMYSIVTSSPNKLLKSYNNENYRNRRGS